jgi:predicted nucleic acid-binding protein
LPLVVSDTSAIRALAHFGSIELLRDLLGEVFIPSAVAEELRAPPEGLPRVDPVDIDFVHIQPAQDRKRVAELRQELDAGESEALVLALELGITAVLIDETTGRAVARRLGLAPLGILGAPVRAKQRGLIDQVTPVMDQLETEIDFFISKPLRAEIKRLAGEE